MIFLFENQNEFVEPANKSYKNATAYLEASLIYKCLYRLDESRVNEIDEIQYITKEQVNEKLMQSGFKKYSADVDDLKDERELMFEIMDRFPEVDELFNTNKRASIESLIRSIKIIKITDKKNEKTIVGEFIKSKNEFLFYIPYSKTFCISLIEKLTDERCSLFSSFNNAKLENVDAYLYPKRSEYLRLYHLLEKIRDACQKKKIDRFPIRRDITTEFLDNIDKNFFDKILRLNNEYRKRLYFFGEDSFIAKRAIDRLLNSVDKYYYYFPQDLNKIDEQQQSMVIYNFDSVNDPKEYKKVYDRVKNTNEAFYIIIQALRNINSQYFTNFGEVELPRDKEIKLKISGLFLSLVVERRIYQDKYWKLFPLIEYNLLKDLIPDTKFEFIYGALKYFNGVMYEDLISNPMFWYAFVEKLNEVVADKKSMQQTGIRTKVVFKKDGENWHITGLGPVIIKNYKITMGIKYLIPIIKSSRSLTSTEVRVAALKYDNQIHILEERKTKINSVENYEFDQLEADRKTIGSAMTNLKSDVLLKDFLKNHFNFSSKWNSFDHKNKYEVDIKDSNWKDEFLL